MSRTEKETVIRHTGLVRFLHWSVALSGLALLFTGFGELPMYKRYNVIKIPGLQWAGDFELNLVIHYIASMVFVAAVIFHLIYHWRRRETAALPRKGDVGESWAIIKAMVRGKKEPPHGKFLAEQRLAYAAIGVVTLALILTGLIKVYKNLGPITLDPTLLQAITLTHTVMAMLFLFLFFAHIGAFLLKANWPLLPSMFTGRVRRDYAEERHPLWVGTGGGEGHAQRSTSEENVVGAAPEAEPRCPVTVKDVLRFVPGVFILVSAVLAVTVSPWWLLLAGFVAVNLLQSAFTRWCLLENILLELGLPEDCRDALSERMS